MGGKEGGGKELPGNTWNSGFIQRKLGPLNFFDESRHLAKIKLNPL